MDNNIQKLIKEQEKTVKRIESIDRTLELLRLKIKKEEENRNNPEYICKKTMDVLKIVLELVKLLKDNIVKMNNISKNINDLDLGSFEVIVNKIITKFMNSTELLYKVDRNVNVKKITSSCYKIEINGISHIIGSDLRNMEDRKQLYVKINKIIKRFNVLQQYYAKKFGVLKAKLDNLVKETKPKETDNNDIFVKVNDNKETNLDTREENIMKILSESSVEGIDEDEENNSEHSDTTYELN